MAEASQRFICSVCAKSYQQRRNLLAHEKTHGGIYTYFCCGKGFASKRELEHHRLLYRKLFGGVTGFTPEHFKKVNGFSNLYFGWGGEDDEMYERVINRKLKLNRLPLEVGRYKMLRHKKAKRNTHKKVKQLLKSVKDRQSTDGLNRLKSHIVKQELKRLYTWILVSINETEIMESGTI